MSKEQTTEDGVTPEFKTLVDRIVAMGHTCQSMLVRLDARIAETAPGPGRDNLLDFRRHLIGKIENGK